MNKLFLNLINNAVNDYTEKRRERCEGLKRQDPKNAAVYERDYETSKNAAADVRVSIFTAAEILAARKRAKNRILDELADTGATKYFESAGGEKFKVVRTSSGYYELTTKRDGFDDVTFKFSTLAECLTEIVSYSEIDAGDFTPDF